MTEPLAYDPTDPAAEFDHYLIGLRHAFLGARRAGGSCLELGCATGYSTSLLARAFEGVTVVEREALYIEKAREYLQGNGLGGRATFVRSDWALLGRAVSGPYSDIVWFQGIESVPMGEAEAILRVTALLLAPGGRIHVVCSNRLSMHRRLGLAMGLIADLDEPSRRDVEYSGKGWLGDRERLAGLCTASGLEVMECVPYFLKPLPNDRMLMMPPGVLDGFARLARELPDYAAEIYVLARPAP